MDIADKLNAHKLTSLLNINKKPYHITLNHKMEEEFNEHIKQIDKLLEVQSPDINQLSSLNSVRGAQVNKNINFGITYPFGDKDLVRREMSFEGDGQERLRIDELGIVLDLKEIETQFKGNIIQKLTDKCEDEELLLNKIESVNQGRLNVQAVINLINNESLARIKRTGAYLYMDYILSNYKDKKNYAYRIAVNYVKRFEQLDAYLNKLTTLPESKSLVYIGANSYNICDILSDGQAFNALPFIGQADGVLLEDKSPDIKTFKIALRMKLNGAVQTANFNSSLEYQLNMINDSQNGDVKRLRAFFLLMFMLTSLDNDNYDPALMWDKLNDRIKKDGPNGFNANVARFVDHCNKKNIHKTAADMKKIFTFCIKQKASGVEKQSYVRNLVLYDGILDDDLDSDSSLFKQVEYNKHYLKYIAVTEEHSPLNLLSIPISLEIYSKSLYEKGSQEYTQLKYDTTDLKVLPVVLYPDFKGGEDLWKTLGSTYHIRIPYSPWSDDVQSEKGFIYTIVYVTLVYVALNKLLKGILDLNPKNLYIAISRMHSTKQQAKGPEVGEYIRDIGKMLEHMLCNHYRAMSQGFVFDRPGAQYAYPNAMSSMYSRLPKKFVQSISFELDKMAIIVVTSRTCDNTFDIDTQINLLVGEVILFYKDRAGNAVCDSWKTFEDYYWIDDLYSSPVILADIVTELYELGFLKILYVAKAPYSNTINITNRTENMYFMNADVIEMMMTNKRGLMVYPLYYERFTAVDYKSSKSLEEALYVSSTQDINKNLPAVAGVLNLYSGRMVGRETHSKHYRSVILYSTLCNIYNNPQFNRAVEHGLIDDTPLKKGIMEFIILLHYTRYEANSKISIKINPYARLMGDEGVATRSVLKFEMKKEHFNMRFNCLAYLTAIKKVLQWTS